MPDDYERVKRHVAQTVASCPRYLKQTIPDLFRRYESLFCKSLPYRKLGFRSVEEMAAKMSDAIEMKVDPKTNGLYLTYRRGFSEHIDRFRDVILKDKIPSEANKRIAQMEEELRQSGDGSPPCPIYRPRTSPPRGPSSLPVSSSLLDRLADIVQRHQGEVWTTNLQQLYRQEYGVDLPVKAFGFKDIAELADVLAAERNVELRRCQLSSCSRLIPRTVTVPDAREVNRALLQFLSQLFFAIPLAHLPRTFSESFPKLQLPASDLITMLRRSGMQLQEVSDGSSSTQLVFGPPLSYAAEAQIAKGPIQWLDASQELRSDCRAFRGHVESLEDFFIIWSEDMEEAEAAEHQLSAHLEASWRTGSWQFTPRRLRVGQPLAIRCNDSAFGWERAELQSVTARSVRCRSCENGRELELALPLAPSHVQALPTEFEARPALARRVRLQHLSARLQHRQEDAVRLLKEAGDRSEYFKVFLGSGPSGEDQPAPVGIEARLRGDAWEDLRAWIHLQLSV